LLGAGARYCGAFANRGSIIWAIRNASAHGSTGGGVTVGGTATLTDSDADPPSINCTHWEPFLFTPK
jgi:hypothetical protein